MDAPVEKTLSVMVPMEIKEKDVADLLCSGMEGGINYWARIVTFKKPAALAFLSDVNQTYPHIDFPMNQGGAVVLESIEGEVQGKTRFTLTRNKLRKGLLVMAKKYPRHFANFISDNADAETGDVFIQCSLFGEIIFG